MPIHGRDPGFARKPCNPEIKDADPLPLVSGEGSSRESSIQNGNTANRRTDSEVPAKGSGGPRTERGKEKSSRNAIKHGIFSTVVLPREPKKMYRGIFHALLDYLKPEDYVERILVEKLAANLWRQGRLVLAESAEIVNTSERARMEMVLDSGRDRENRETKGGMIADGAHSASLERGIDLWRKLRALVEERGFDLDADAITLFKLFGPVVEGHLPDDGELTYYYWLKCSKVYVENRQSKAGIPLEEAKKHAIEMIDTQIRWAECRRQILKPFEEILRLSRVDSLFPSEMAVQKTIRYEVHLSREFDRTLQQLERLRRIRTGQPTPPPIEVKLST